MKNVRVITASWIIMLVTASSWASSPAPDQSTGLGTVHFANSCSPTVQAEFEAALALLHSFEYEVAEKKFSHVAELDPQCAIAYWGAAMTLYHQLWDWPQAGAIEKGREYLQQAKELHHNSKRERAYLAAAYVFFQPSQNLGRNSRVQAYSRAMLGLHKRYPQDDDATAFYALSLLTLPSAGSDGLGNARKAIAVLSKLLADRPCHPGAAHYLIHAADSRELAELGLSAALRYAQIAPASPHALHMPSHIFVRLGMWQESIRSNLASIAGTEDGTQPDREDKSGDALHAMMYLSYSYLQNGQDEEARLLTDRIRSIPGATKADIVNNVAISEALTAVETHQWQKAASLVEELSAFPYARVRIYWARAIGAARKGDLVSAHDNIEKLTEARTRMLVYGHSVDAQMHMAHSMKPDVSVQQLEAQAWLAWAEGKSGQALDDMRAAAAMEKSFSVESRTVPAYEMLGDLLLELNQPQAALDAYTTALKDSPARLNALAGAARASLALGNAEDARSYYQILVKCCDPLATREELGEARLFLSGN